jgi:ATP-binding cassette subfamily F protein 3
VLTRPDLLILDEPTNHLDIASCETLTQLLQGYNGTLLLVSHDRYLLNAVTNKTLGLTGDGRATLLEGNHAAWRESQAVRPPATEKKDAPRSAPPREDGKRRGKAQASIEIAEATVGALEVRLAELEAALATGEGDLVALAAEHTAVQKSLADALTAWEDAVVAPG